MDLIALVPLDDCVKKGQVISFDGDGDRAWIASNSRAWLADREKIGSWANEPKIKHAATALRCEDEATGAIAPAINPSTTHLRNAWIAASRTRKF